MTTRREFVKNTVITSAALGLAPALSGALAGCAPSDRINVGLIGCNGMGFADLKAFLDHPQVECIGCTQVHQEYSETGDCNGQRIRYRWWPCTACNL